MRKLTFILLAVCLIITGYPLTVSAQEGVIFMGGSPIPYEERLDFVQAVEDVLSGFNDRITELEAMKADPYTTIYTTLKQKRDAIEYKLNYVDTLERGEWEATREEIIGRVNELATDLQNLPNISQVYRMQLPAIMV